MYSLRLEDEQLTVARDLFGVIELESRRAAIHHRDGPGRMRMPPIGMRDEICLQRLHAGEALRPYVGRRLAHTGARWHVCPG